MTAQIQRVLIATDFSERSLHAARWAVHHVADNAEVVLLHVVPLPDAPGFVRSRFPEIGVVETSATAGAAQRLREVARSYGVRRVQTEVRVGGPADQIAAVAWDVQADLVVVARHSDRPGVLHRLGTTADRLVRLSPTPVLLATSIRDTQPRHIVAALDDADITPHVVEWTRFLATRFNADVTALHVITSAIMNRIASGACLEQGVTLSLPTMREQVAREGVRWLEGVCAGPDATSISTEVAFGWVSKEIVDAAERNLAELIVIGRTGSGLGHRMLLGDVTRRVLHSARCPVLVVTEPQLEASATTAA